MAETAYIVLRRVQAHAGDLDVTKFEQTPMWETVGEIAAPTAEAAIRLVAPTLNPADGAYVATPMRSWRPLTVTATTQTVLKVGAQPEPT